MRSPALLLSFRIKLPMLIKFLARISRFFNSAFDRFNALINQTFAQQLRNKLIVCQQRNNTSSDTANGGSITLNATNNSINVNSLTSGSSALDGGGNPIGNGGAITLNAVDTINSGVVNTVGIVSDGTPGGGGVNGASVSITSVNGDINLTGLLGLANSSVRGQSIEINTLGNLFVAGSLNARSDVSGSAGGITIGNTSPPSSMIVAAISTRNFRNGVGGEINITTTGSFISNDVAGRDSGLILEPNQPINDGFSIGSESFGSGGRINIQAGEITIRAGIVSNSQTVGNGGNISLRASSGGITIQAGTLDSSAQIGEGGRITLSAATNVEVDGDVLSRSQISGNGGEITATSRSGAIQTDALDSSANLGNGGSIALNSNRNIQITGNVSSDSASIGNGGDVAFISQRGAIDTTAGTINASGGAIGNGGDVTLRTPSNISSGSIVTAGLTGVGGEIALDSGNRLLINNADIASITGGAGTGGNIELNADLLRLTGSRVGTVTNSAGGDINIDANSVQLEDALIGTIATLGNGRGGNIQITNANTIRIRNSSADSIPSNPLFEPLLATIDPSVDFVARIQRGSGLATTTTAAGEAGDISIDTDRLNIFAEAEADGQTGVSTLALTGSRRRSGNLTINAAESVRITGNDQREQFNPQPNTDTAGEVNGIQTGITSATLGSGDAGRLTITTDRLVLRNGAAITSGNGRSGENAGTGDGGALTINAQSVDLRGLAALATVTFSEGRAGNLTVNSDRITLNRGAIFAADTLGRGEAGSIQVTTDNLEILSGSRIGAATTGSGIGGEITINQAGDRANRVEIAGTSTSDRELRSGIFTNSQGRESAGNISIFAEQLNVRDRAEISVSSSGSGAAGNLFVAADNILLDQQARLRGTTQESLEGGNLRITADRNIELRNDGGADETEITTQAAANSDGGRITVTAGQRIFSTFSQNSDVVADADRGQGGLVVGEAPLITGFRQYGGTRTGKSDFVAGSRQGTPGIVEAPEADVPAPLPDAPDLPRIDQVCPATSGLTTRAAGTSQFLNTGRGGLPPNSAESIDSSTVQVPWVTLSPSEATSDRSAESSAVIEEAQGWQRLPSGELLLTTTATTPLPCVSSSGQ